LALTMNWKQVQEFARNNSMAMALYNNAAQDYGACRCCLINGFFPGFILGAQAIEKILKAFILLHDNKVNPKSFSHNLTKLVDEVQKNNDYGLARFLPLIRRLQIDYQTRYPDNPCKGASSSTGQLVEIDELIFYLIDQIPLPDEVKFKSGVYSMLFPGNPNSPWHKWISIYNRTLTEFYGNLERRFVEIKNHLSWER